MGAIEHHGELDANPLRRVALKDVAGTGVEFDASHAAMYQARMDDGKPTTVQELGVPYRAATSAEKDAFLGVTGSVVDYSNLPSADTGDWVRIDLVKSQLDSDINKAINADTVNKLTWTLSALGFDGTPKEQLDQAITTLGTVSVGKRTLIIDMDIECPDDNPTVLPIINLTLKAQNVGQTTIFASGTQTGASRRNYLIEATAAADNFKMEGIVVKGFNKCKAALISARGSDILIDSCDISNDTAENIYAQENSTYGVVPAISVTASGAGFHIRNTKMHDAYQFLNLGAAPSDVTVERCNFSDYTARAIFLRAPIKNFKSLFNIYGMPANCRLSQEGTTTSTGAIRQPVACQADNDFTLFSENLIFRGDVFIGSGEPYGSDNSNDSPSGSADILSRATADALSIHRARNVIIDGISGSGHGEVFLTISRGAQNVSVKNCVSNGSDTVGISCGAFNLPTEERVKDISIDGFDIHNASLDKLHDHTRLPAASFSSADNVSIRGMNITSDLEAGTPYDSTVSYNVGDRVYIPIGSELLTSWLGTASSEFVPGFVFRNTSPTQGAGQFVYEVPAGFTGGKGAAFDATEEARYISRGTNPEVLAQEGVTFMALQANTGSPPQHDFDSVNWTSDGIEEVFAWGVRFLDCTNISEYDTSINGQVLNTYDYDDTSTFERLSIESVDAEADLPLMTPNSNNGNRFIYIGEVRYFCRNGVWAAEGVPLAGNINRWGGSFSSGGNISNGVNITSNAARPNTGEFIITLDTPLPSTNAVAIANCAASTRSGVATIIDVNTIQVNTSTGTAQTASNTAFDLIVIA